jgi:GrpB-like predicted nucleotidyltransferase (UPF0157 family)
MTSPPLDEPIVLVDYDPRWPALFERERARVATALTSLAPAIEHIGSTAVPGLCAKPIIDMLVIVEHLDAAARYIPALAPLGYRYFPHASDSTSTTRHAFGLRDADGRRPIPGYNVHIVQRDGPDHQRHIAFRDHLRAHPDDRQAYCALKRQLAAAHGADRDGYTNAKTAFVREVEARCEHG